MVLFFPAHLAAVLFQAVRARRVPDHIPAVFGGDFLVVYLKFT